MTLRWETLSTALLILCTFLSCQKEKVIDLTRKTDLEKVVDSEFKRLSMPGLACIAVKGDSVVYRGLRGYANRKDKKEFTSQTRMLIASTSKTVTLVAIMQLYEKGLISLDSDVNLYLPFQVRNPAHPDIPITVRMLLTHTSSISDGGYLPSLYYLFGYVDYPETLMSFEKNYLTPTGKNYTRQNYTKNKPGQVAAYSNVGIALVACLVEHVTNVNFTQYCQTRIFEPLGMTKTTWLFSETPESEVAIPYADNTIENPAKPFYSYPTYPDGHLLTTIDDLSIFLRAFLMGGKFNNYQLLQPQTIAMVLHENLTIPTGKQGLVFFQHPIGQFDVWGHNGGDPGISTEMYFDTAKQVGYIMFNNRTEAYSTTLGNALLLYAYQ